MSLTAAAIRKARPRAQTYELPDERGLVLRVTSSGTKSWAVYFREGGRKRRRTVGRWPDVSIRDARAMRDRLRQRAAGESAMTVAAFAEVYLDRWARPHKRTADYDERALERDILPVIGDRPILTLTRADCVAVVDRVQDRGAQSMAARTKAVLHRVLQYAVERGVRDDNPAREITVPQGPARDRVLGNQELRVWWRTLRSFGVPELVFRALSLQLATGQRLGEVLTIEPHDIDHRDRIWTVPGRKAKNGVTHTVPLSGWAYEIIEQAPPHRRGRYLLPVSDNTVRDWMRAVVRVADIDRTTPHDLRRTVATWLGRLGYDRTVQDKLLNHIDQSVAAVYDRYSYDAEKRQALEDWAHQVAIITGDDRHQSGTATRGDDAARAAR